MMRKKQKKPVMPWRVGILDHHKHQQKRNSRNEFPLSVVEALKRESDGLCQVCCVSRGTQTHHIMPRSRGGRGVKENGIRICNFCHNRIHANEAELQKLIDRQRAKYGEHFWFDELDRELYHKEEA